MIKKQTVWLITMLSLMIVLSVYYMTLDDTAEDFAQPDPDTDQNLNDSKVTTEITDDNDEGNEGDQEDNDLDQALDNDGATIHDITNIGREELFTTIRMQVQNQRSMEKSRYEDIVASGSTTVDEKNEALDYIHSLEKIDTKETILQNRILSTTDAYEDVLVRFDEDLVYVHVQADELSSSEANYIMQLVHDEFGEMEVAIVID